jgi:two-component system sensor histidine kinase BaeS
MDLARAGAADLRLASREVDLAETVRAAVGSHAPAAADAHVLLEAMIGGSLVDGSLVIRTDPDRVHQVISNLIENALRVTEAGGRVLVAARGADGGVVIEVTDTGPGIRPTDLPHIFERSYLWRRVRGSGAVGTGLGLAIVRELVTALGGTITVDSVVDRGSVFRIELGSHA